MEPNLYPLEQLQPWQLYGLEGESTVNGLSGLDGRKDIYQRVNELLLKRIEKEGLFWTDGRKTTARTVDGEVLNFPVNFLTKKPYRGINILLLDSMGYENPYWLTLKQANKLGGKIRKGEQGTPVVFYSFFWVHPDTKKKYFTEEQARKEIPAYALYEAKTPYLKEWTVFNAAQIEGIDFGIEIENLDETDERAQELAIENAELLVANYPKPAPPIRHSRKFEKYYSHSRTSLKEYIHMPHIFLFENPQRYYKVLFHELVHSTGHPTRLNREMSGNMKSKTYAAEELIAEFGASYLCAETGILNFVIDNAAAYIQGWKRSIAENLKKDKRWLVVTSQQAQKAADYIMGAESVLEKAAKNAAKHKFNKADFEKELASHLPLLEQELEAVPAMGGLRGTDLNLDNGKLFPAIKYLFSVDHWVYLASFGIFPFKVEYLFRNSTVFNIIKTADGTSLIIGVTAHSTILSARFTINTKKNYEIGVHGIYLTPDEEAQAALCT